MNAPTYEKKDYSYLPETFQKASQGFRQFGQGLKTAMDIGDRERKRAQEDEIIKNVRISNADADKVRDNAIAELAVDIMKVMGLPSTDEGRNEAYNRAVKFYYPLTPEEKKSGTGLTRLWTQEQDKVPKYLGDLAEKNWLNKVYQATGKFAFPQKQDIQEPVGTVGVEEEGKVRRPLASGPLSAQEMQRGAEKTLAEQPSYIEKMPSPVDLDLQQLWREATELGIADREKIRNTMNYLQRQQITQGKPEGEPLTSQYVATETYGMPVADEKEVMKYLPKEMEEKDRIKLAIEKIRALKKADTQDQVDNNILKVKGEVNKLREMYIRNGTTINRLNQAIARMEQGKTLGSGFDALLQSISVDPKKPTLYELRNESDRLRMNNERINEAIKESEDIVSDLSGGYSLSEAIKNIEKKKQKTVDDAIKYFRDEKAHLFLDEGRNTTIRVILDVMPPTYKKVLKERVQFLKDRGVKDKDIIDRIFGREYHGD